MENEVFYCTICGKILHPISEELKCIYCKEISIADYTCDDHHFVCENCRLALPDELILKTCERSETKNPYELANLIMRHPAIPMHSPIHHYLVPAVLLTALKNVGCELPRRAINIAIKRGKKIPYGTCGSWGVCGAGAGVGIAMSVLTRATYKSDTERARSLDASGESLISISKLGGPRCCKASVYASIKSAISFLEKNFKIKLPSNFEECPFSSYNEECKKDKCEYYKGGH
ncbi:MAG: DUF5714 domain-containing protein [Candidatus Jordarchaeum sp.]|uniref:DUF5714 domain-containing protein n=1 Tax=Candidatus Jordarchaeum sp. TaxID=2823881 RepID=UPI00404B7A32